MNVLMILIMYFSLLGADVQDPTPINSVEDGLVELNQMFPDWHDNYEIGEFDCSEMSAFVCTYFEVHGFDAQMQRGYNSKNKKNGHAWVLVDDKIIECMRLEIADNPNHFAKKPPHYIPNNYYQNTGDIDWWNSKYILDRVEGFESMKLSDYAFDVYYHPDILAYTNDIPRK